ncbi:fibrillin-2-like isoform X48 [Paramuricea clavata]|uniref:Fibrillin-2-like isoform X48 n=1 Tax=Paramuricea clavata TaxID=317549 RepID=A0A7D9IW96_PARCT|nr:fibrillin-2-like isoform X48 [Paramuricea clavata]
MNKIAGLCGTFNQNPGDDLLIETRTTVGSAVDFGNSWKTDPDGDDAPVVPHPCETYPERNATATANCSALLTSPFNVCASQVDPVTGGYIDDCRYDVCGCGVDPTVCLCQAIEAYVADCASYGVIIIWLSDDRYQQCDSPCASAPCFNGGTCSNSGTSFSCSCPVGYSGDRCEIQVSPTPSTTDPTVSTTPNTTDPTVSTTPNITDPTVSTTSNITDPTVSTTPSTTNPTVSTTPSTTDPTVSTTPSTTDPTVSTTPTTPVLPCGSNPCMNGGNCSDNGTSFSCSCPVGYTAQLCDDINECSQANICHAQATCNNTQGSYVCTCNTGYTGNGTICSDIDECSQANMCHADATCTNTPGSYLCTCNTGYTGNGTYCVGQ